MSVGGSPRADEADGGPLPKEVASRLVYEGRVVTLSVDELALSGGRRAEREVIDHPGAVVMIALDERDNVYLVRQYRHAIRRELLELPAGTLETGEEPLQAAKRELREEVGLLADQWTRVGTFYSSPGFLNECLHVFLARGLTQHEPDPDVDEDLSVVVMPLAELERIRGEIHDAKTLAALYLFREGASHGTQS